ncbi:Transposase [Caligus rogercresseyi]|uniref:Transposase n=1 Tax=Caligus rogercresseyi TaxID=217165 RepID=A0A7T8KHG0_CALRO|nr:Transposase [Caligus rogercresseyi]
MSIFVPTNYDLRTALLFCFHLKKTAAELHRMLAEAFSDEKWIYFENPKRNKSWVTPGEPSTSTPRPNRYGRKTMLCVWWDQKGVIYYELLKPGETVNTQRYRQQMTDLDRVLREKRPEYQQRQHKVILLHDKAPAHKAKQVQETIESFRWEILQHTAYSPDLAPSDYYLFASMGALFTSYEDVRKWLDDWFASKEQQFFWRGIHKLPERWENV